MDPHFFRIHHEVTIPETVRDRRRRKAEDGRRKGKQREINVRKTRVQRLETGRGLFVEMLIRWMPDREDCNEKAQA